MTRGTPVAVAVSEQQTCVEVGTEGEQGSWCAPTDRREAVWLGAATAHEGAVVVGQAPPDVISVVLIRDGRVRRLVADDLGAGRFFVGVSVPWGQYDVEALRADGTVHVSGEMRLSRHATTSATFMP